MSTGLHAVLATDYNHLSEALSNSNITLPQYTEPFVSHNSELLNSISIRLIVNIKRRSN